MTPEPPPGMRLLSDEEKKLPLPMDAMIFTQDIDGDAWLSWLSWLSSIWRNQYAPTYLRHRAYATAAPSPIPQAPTDSDGWRDIATAPKDGTPVLGYAEDWIHDDYNPSGIRECFCDGDGFWQSPEWNNYQDVYETGDGSPTHWQPLPPPPSRQL